MLHLISVGIIANIKAKLIKKFKDISAEGNIVEMVIWRVPEPVPPTSHGYKYRLVYIVDGERKVGFDNERGKGDHFHLSEKEISYEFVDFETLIEDFIKEVDQWKREH